MEPSLEILALLCKKLNIDIEKTDDTPKLVPLFKDDIERLYNAIKHSDYDVSYSIYSTINLKYKTLTHPAFLLVKKLFDLRFAMLNNQLDSAKQLYFEIQGISAYNDTFSRDYYHRFCGLYNYLYGNLEHSLNHYKNAENLSFREDIEEVYYQMGLVYTRLGNIALSTYYTAKALTRYENKMNYRLCKNCNLLLAVNYRKMGENEKALNMYEAILNGLTGDADKKLKAKVLHNIGFIHFQMGNKSEAIDFFKKSISYKGKDIDPSNTLYLLAKTYLDLKDTENARKLIKEGNTLSHLYDNEDYLIKFQVMEYLLEGNSRSSVFEEYMQSSALPYFKNKNERNTVIEFTKILAEYYESNHKYKNAYTLLKTLL